MAHHSRSGQKFKLLGAIGLGIVASLVVTGAVMWVSASNRATEFEEARVSAISVAEDVLLEASYSAARDAFGSDAYNDRYHRYVVANGQPPGDAELASWDSKYDPMAIREFLMNAKPGERWRPEVPLQERFNRRAHEEYSAVWAYELLLLLRDPKEFKHKFLPHFDAYLARKKRMESEGASEGEIVGYLAFYVFEKLTTEEMHAACKSRILRK